MKGESSEICQNSDSQDEVVERVKARLQEEGREARNLVAYSLPLQDPPHVEPMVRLREVKPVTEAAPRRTTKQDKRPRSASAGRDPQASLRARHWGFLFRNLQQAVDEIYQTCEDDESIVECKEAIMMLERYSSDFHKLIEWLKLKWEYEHTPPPQRPTSLTWEIRTSSPGKALHHDRKILSLSDARRALTFDSNNSDRMGMLNGNLQERKTPTKLHKSKPDGLREVGKPGGTSLGSSSKPLIIVHQVSIEEKLERVKEVESTPLEKVKECVMYESVEMSKSEEDKKTYKPNTDVVVNCKDKARKVDVGKVENGSENKSNDICKVVESKNKKMVSENSSERGNKVNPKTISESRDNNADKKVCDINCSDLCKGKTEDGNKCIHSSTSPDYKEKNDLNLNKTFESKSRDPKPLNSTTVSSKTKENVTVSSKQSLDSSPSTKSQHESPSNKLCEGGEAKRSCAEVLQTKSPVQKPGPTVYMNKASQVRQAYNQNRTPQKQPRSVSASNRHPLAPRPTDFKTTIIKQQGGGGKVTCRRMGEGRALMGNSPPTAHRQTVVEAGGAGGRGGSARHTPLPHTVMRSHSSLGTTTTATNRGGVVRGSTSYGTSNTGRAYGSTSLTNECFGGQEWTASSSSLSSGTSSSGQSWADKVRGVTSSLPSSHLSLQDDEEGWEVVRRGRRSHGGSTVSLNNNNNNNYSCNNNHQHSKRNAKDTRSGSLNIDGHTGGDIKKRFLKPSSAMSMPSLAINKSSESCDVQDSKDDNSFHRANQNTRVTEHSDTGKKPVMHTSSVPLPDPTEHKEDRKAMTQDPRRQTTSLSKKLDNKKNRRNVRSAEELRRKGLSREDGLERCVTREFSSDVNKCRKLKEKDQRDDSRTEHSEKEKTKGKKGHSEDDVDERWQGERTADTLHQCPLSEKKQQSNTVTGNNNHLCNPAIREISETSDRNGGDRKEKPIRTFYQFHVPENLNSSTTVGHHCDSVIPEISETSDGDEEGSGRTKDEENGYEEGGTGVVGTKQQGGKEGVRDGVSLVSSTMREGKRESDLTRSESDTKNYDSDSQNDDEEFLKNAAALESAVQEEQRLKQQIEETEKAEIKVEDEEDCEEEEEEDCSDTSESVVGGGARSLLTPPPYDTLLSTMSWADQVDAFESLEELRHPGRVLHIHEKLSSPSRKRSLSEKMRRHEERLAKAKELRENLILVKTEKLKDLFKKIEEVRQDKEVLLLKKKDLFQRKMKHAEEKRRQYLQEIVNKAHDEENKAKEIAFINGLEAQNKLHDIMQQHQSHESRLADMAEERTRRQEEKAAKEVAAQERRRALEAERQARMAELCEKRRQRCERIDRQQAERREELLEQAREKARDREERLSALQQAQQAKETELVKKIQQKQEESARRHEENIEQIRQRALESSIMKYSRGCDEAPKLVRYETKKLCTLCNSLITSEVYLLSHLRGRRHQEALRSLHQGDVVSSEDSETYNLKHIIDAPANIDDPQVTRDKERHKALKKRCRKIRNRMITRGKEYNRAFKPTPIREAPNKVRITKALQQIAKLVANQGTGPWPTADVAALDRPLLELKRLLDKKEKTDQMVFIAQDGFNKLNSVLKVVMDSTEQQPCILPAKSLCYSGQVLVGACRGNVDNCRFVLNSNLVGFFVDYLMQRLNELVTESTRAGSNNSINTIVNLSSDSVSGALFEVVAEAVDVLCERDLRPPNNTDNKEQADETWLRLQDLVSYCVSVGLVDKVWWYLGQIQGPVDNDSGVVELVLAAMRLVTALSKAVAARRPADDPTQLVGTLHATDACGVVSLLYGLLLHQGGRSAMPNPPPRLSPTSQSITAAATTFLHNLASLDLNTFQSILGGEGISLEFRHIASYLLWYCSHWPSDDILHNVIPLVGFFTVNNKENQAVVQSGEVPSVLQQLCNLPWQYFSESHLTSVLFPTLLACCLANQDNMVILQQEMSFQVLEDFLHSSQGADKPLLHILRRANVQG